jgi:hypothetical protein
MVPPGEIIVVQTEVLAALRRAVGVAVVWPWDRLGEIGNEGCPWITIEAALVGAGFDPVVLGPAVSVNELIDCSLEREMTALAI